MSATNARYRIGKIFRFEATRRIDDGRFDGNSFNAQVVLSSAALSPVGFVADFGDLDPLKRYIDQNLDHNVLNEAAQDVTDEGLAEHLTRWASDHLPIHVASVLEQIQVRTGRPMPLPTSSFAAFGATHRLLGLRKDHPCGHLHGHTYVVSAPASVDSRREDVPMLLRSHLHAALQGSVLNEVIPDLNPTSENLAKYVADWLTDHGADRAGQSSGPVRVSETETSWAEYEEGSR